MKRSPGSNIPRPSLSQSLWPFAKRTPNPTKNGIAKPAEIIGQLIKNLNFMGSVTTLGHGDDPMRWKWTTQKTESGRFGLVDDCRPKGLKVDGFSNINLAVPRIKLHFDLRPSTFERIVRFRVTVEFKKRPLSSFPTGLYIQNIFNVTAIFPIETHRKLGQL